MSQKTFSIIVQFNGNYRSFRLPFSAAVPFGFCLVNRSVLFHFVLFGSVSFRLCALTVSAEIIERASD